LFEEIVGDFGEFATAENFGKNLAGIPALLDPARAALNEEGS
jgi:hypothetical protein